MLNINIIYHTKQTVNLCERRKTICVCNVQDTLSISGDAFFTFAKKLEIVILYNPIKLIIGFAMMKGGETGIGHSWRTPCIHRHLGVHKAPELISDVDLR
jgi:hypothetical protein